MLYGHRATSFNWHLEKENVFLENEKYVWSPSERQSNDFTIWRKSECHQRAAHFAANQCTEYDDGER